MNQLTEIRWQNVKVCALKLYVSSQSIHQSLAALSKVIRGTQLLTPEVQKLATALLNQEVRHAERKKERTNERTKEGESEKERKTPHCFRGEDVVKLRPQQLAHI